MLVTLQSAMNKITLDPFQQEAADYIQRGESVIVSAPTGAGKTLIAEQAIIEALKANKTVVYTAPVKALSNQKYRDFKKIYGEKVGIITGDLSFNSQASILIMTTEIYRNRLFESHEQLEDIGWVIFDEVHYLDDVERGSVWEESLMFTPQHINILCLSATIPNMDELSAWINSIHKRKMHVVKMDKRPVPLSHQFQCCNQILQSAEKLKYLMFSAIPRVKQFRKYHYTAKGPGVKQNKLEKLIDHILEEKQLPAIYFAFSRVKTQTLANSISLYNFLTQEESEATEKLYHELCQTFDLTAESSAISLGRLVTKGIAYHHAGMLPALKDIIERLFNDKMLKFIFTTETFALGINMPAKTVIFDELRKFYGMGFKALNTRDYFQMAGRAGRRGIDTEGFVYSRVNPKFTNYNAIHKTIFSQPEPVISQFNANYATILNLYNRMGPNLIKVYPSSFHYYQSSKTKRKEAVKLLEKKIQMLTMLGFIKDFRLTSKGYFASNLYGYELILGEMYVNSFLESLSVENLCIVLNAVVFEPRKNDPWPILTPPIKELLQTCRKFKKSTDRIESKFKMDPLSKAPHFNLTELLAQWLSGKSFSRIIEQEQFDEGTIIRYFRMTLQLLRQIASNPITDPLLKENCLQGTKLMNKGIVDAEWQFKI